MENVSFDPIITGHINLQAQLLVDHASASHHDLTIVLLHTHLLMMNEKNM